MIINLLRYEIEDVRAAIEDYRQKTDDDGIDGPAWWGQASRDEATRQFMTRMDEILLVAKARMLRGASPAAGLKNISVPDAK